LLYSAYRPGTGFQNRLQQDLPLLMSGLEVETTLPRYRVGVTPLDLGELEIRVEASRVF